MLVHAKYWLFLIIKTHPIPDRKLPPHNCFAFSLIEDQVSPRVSTLRQRPRNQNYISQYEDQDFEPDEYPSTPRRSIVSQINRKIAISRKNFKLTFF